MVMETMEAPSPQCVGLEFVRQYYTVLNKAPMHLHRFYSHNSLFMHGGPSSDNNPTVGQADIHKKIVSLNFQDCHAKIRMVDAHATLGNGVVIQVTGELSNSGLPMRRFMQTFVLAPQSPKKYYLHNDIFRYQDEVFSDEETVEDGNSDPEEELDAPISSVVENTTFPSNSSRINGTSHHETIPTTPATLASSTHMSSPSQSQVSSPPTGAPAPTPPVSSPPAQTPVSHDPPQPSTPPPETDGWDTPRGSSDEWADPIEESIVIQSPSSKKDTKSPTSKTEGVSQSAPSKTSSSEPKAKTFANLFKNTSSSFSQSAGDSPGLHQSYSSPSGNTSRLSEFGAGRGGASQGGPSPGRGDISGNSRMSRNYYFDDDKRRFAVPDSQQVFVGNLPHSIGEDQLRNAFNQFGKILEVRINIGKGKTGIKGPSHQVPNFGFIAFEDETAVVKCLEARPIYLNGESRLNVEEKKAKSRMDISGGMGVRPIGGRSSLGSGGLRGHGGMMQGRDSRGGGGRGFSRDSRGGSRGGFMMRR